MLDTKIYPKHWPNVHQIKTLFTYHFQKPCPYSLFKINWTVPHSVVSKLKSRFCSHPITFLGHSTFSKILHISLLPLPQPFLQVVRDACVLHHIYSIKNLSLLSQNSITSYRNHGSVWVSACCWKHTLSLVFVYCDGFRCWPSGLAGACLPPQ